MIQHGLSASGPSPLTQTLKMIHVLIQQCQLELRPRCEIPELMVTSGIDNPRMKIQDPRADGKFWHRQSEDEDPGLSSSGLEQRRTCQVWRETHQGIAAIPRLGSIDEQDEEALREWRMRRPKH